MIRWELNKQMKFVLIVSKNYRYIGAINMVLLEEAYEFFEVLFGWEVVATVRPDCLLKVEQILVAIIHEINR